MNLMFIFMLEIKKYKKQKNMFSYQSIVYTLKNKIRWLFNFYSIYKQSL